MVVGLAGEKFEREAGFRSRSMARFVRRSEGDNRIKTLTLKSLAVKRSFAVARRKVALGKGEEWVGGGITNGVGTDALVRPAEYSSARIVVAFKIQTDKMLAFQAIARNSLQPRIGRLERAVDH